MAGDSTQRKARKAQHSRPDPEEVPPWRADGYHGLPYRLFIVSAHVSMCIRHYYGRKYGLSLNNWRIISILSRYGQLAAKDVAYRSGFDRIRVTRSVDQLVRMKLVSRDSDTADRRRVVLALTPKGRAVFDDVMPIVRNIEQRLLEGLPDDALATLEGILDRFEQRCEEIFDTHHSVEPFLPRNSKRSAAASRQAAGLNLKEATA